MSNSVSGTATIVLTAALAATAGAPSSYASPVQPVRNVLLDSDGTHQNSTAPALDHIQYELWPDATKRLRYLGALGEDHDGEGAAAPSRESIAEAVSFVQQLPFYAPDPIVGIDDDGNAVVEFHDGSELGQLIFKGDRAVEAFYSRSHAEPVSFEGSCEDGQFLDAFVQTFGFRFAA